MIYNWKINILGCLIQLKKHINNYYLVFSENQYNLKDEGNTLSLNIEIEHSHKKNIIPFILQKSNIKINDLIKSLYIILNNYAKENNGLKRIY